MFPCGRVFGTNLPFSYARKLAPFAKHLLLSCCYEGHSILSHTNSTMDTRLNVEYLDNFRFDKVIENREILQALWRFDDRFRRTLCLPSLGHITHSASNLDRTMPNASISNRCSSPPSKRTAPVSPSAQQDGHRLQSHSNDSTSSLSPAHQELSSFLKAPDDIAAPPSLAHQADQSLQPPLEENHVSPLAKSISSLSSKNRKRHHDDHSKRMVKAICDLQDLERYPETGSWEDLCSDGNSSTFKRLFSTLCNVDCRKKDLNFLERVCGILMEYEVGEVRDDRFQRTCKLRTRPALLKEFAHSNQISLKVLTYKMRAAPKFVHILEKYGPGCLALLKNNKTWGEMPIKEIDDFFTSFSGNSNFCRLQKPAARFVLDITKQFWGTHKLLLNRDNWFMESLIKFAPSVVAEYMTTLFRTGDISAAQLCSRLSLPGTERLPVEKIHGSTLGQTPDIPQSLEDRMIDIFSPTTTNALTSPNQSKFMTHFTRQGEQPPFANSLTTSHPSHTTFAIHSPSQGEPSPFTNFSMATHPSHNTFAIHSSGQGELSPFTNFSMAAHPAQNTIQIHEKLQGSP